MSIINSKVAICNLALNHLGINEITSIEFPETETAKTCANFYDIAKEEILRDCLFQFSIKRAVLPVLNEAPVFGWSKQAKLPADFLYLIYIYSGERPLINNGVSYRIEGNKILTNLDAPYYLLYVAKIEDVNQFTEEFKLLLSYYLAYLIGNKVGATTDKIQKAQNDMMLLWAKAKSHNANDWRPIRVNNSKYQEIFTNVGGTTGSEVYF